MTKQSATKKGVESAWDFWLGQHPVSVPEIIEEAITKSFMRWMDDHEDEIIAAIADRKKKDLEDGQ